MPSPRKRQGFVSIFRNVTHLIGKLGKPFRRLIALSAGLWLTSTPSVPLIAADTAIEMSSDRLLAIPATRDDQACEKRAEGERDARA